jgi:hypothetical protein
VTARVVTCDCGASEREDIIASRALRGEDGRWRLRSKEWACPDCVAAEAIADALCPWDRIDLDSAA